MASNGVKPSMLVKMSERLAWVFTCGKCGKVKIISRIEIAEMPNAHREYGRVECKCGNIAYFGGYV